jgi:hypothetical protein
MKNVSHYSLFLFFLLFAHTSFAEDTLRWKDSQGRVFYGAHPPEDATEVTPLSGKKGLSKYSSQRMLNRLKKEEPIADTAAEKIDVLRFSTQADLAVSYNEKKEITACSVKLINKTQQAVSNLEVSFIFEDNSVIQAVGPTEILEASQAIFEIPLERLPLALTTTNEEKSSDNDKQQTTTPTDPKILALGSIDKEVDKEIVTQ